MTIVLQNNIPKVASAHAMRLSDRRSLQEDALGFRTHSTHTHACIHTTLTHAHTHTHTLIHIPDTHKHKHMYMHIGTCQKNTTIMTVVTHSNNDNTEHMATLP